MSDNLTATSSLKVRIYRSYTSGSAGTATTADPELTNASGDIAGVGSTSLTLVRGLSGTNTYINYLLRVEDDSGNATTSTLSVYSQNAITISSIWPASGVTAGSKYVVIDGTGIDDSATVTIGGNTCTSKQVIRSGYKLACKTPAGMGANDVVITNPSGAGSATLANGYTYSDAVYCNVSGRASATPFANSSDGSGADGTFTKPYKICTFAQLDAIRTSSSSGGGKYWELADHIDASGQAFAPLLFNGANTGSVNGNNYAVLNITYTSSTTASSVGLFAGLGGGYIKNIGVVNASFTYTGTSSAGNWSILAGSMAGTGTYIENVYTSGILDVPAICTSNCGIGAVVGNVNSSTSYVQSATNYADVKGPHGTGGVIGRGQSLMSVTGSSNYGTITCRANNNGSSGVGCGGIVGFANATVSAISNLSNYGAIVIDTTAGTSTGYVGGLIGSVPATTATYSNLRSIGNITGSSGTYVGGIFGNIGSSVGVTLIIDNATYSGSIAVPACGTCGGIMGFAEPQVTITNSNSKGTITGSTDLGGLIGRTVANATSAGTLNISASYSTMNLTASSGNVGGLIGRAYCNANCSGNTRQYTIQNSYYDGIVSAQSGSVGGMVGSFGSASTIEVLSISNSYTRGTISSTSGTVGGMIGYVGSAAQGADSTTINVTDSYSTMTLAALNNLGGITGNFSKTVGGTTSYNITRSYFAGTLTANSSWNGLVGQRTNSPSVTCTDAFYNSTMAAASASGCTSGGSAVTSTQMQSSSTFTNFDFTPTTGVWKMPSTTGFPLLMWE